MRIVHALDPDRRAVWGRSVGDAVEIVDGTPFDGGTLFARRPTREILPLARLHLLAPAAPTKIVGIGRNYRDHAAELGNALPTEPLIFLKAPSALIGPGEALKLPPESTRVDYEGELALVFGAQTRRLPATRWRDAVLGFTVACDATARDLQKKDVQFARAKSFDSFCPLGPWIETELDTAVGRLTTKVDGETRQDGRFSDLVFPIPQLVEAVTAAMTIFPGDILLTGTPAGVGPLAAGQKVEIEISGIGVLSFSVENE